jgi:hypothetical protein
VTPLPLLLPLFAGCRPEPTCAPPAWEDLDGPVFAGVVSDFTAGQLVLGGADGTTSAPVLSVSGDALVRSADGFLYVVERGGPEAVTKIDPDDPLVPVWQAELPAGANAHDLVAFAGALWLPAFGLGEVVVLDPADGSTVQRVDLSAFADDDGNPELDRALVLGDPEVLVVAAQRLFDDPVLGPSVLTSADGRLIALDATGAVVGSWETGPNPRLAMGASEALVSTGLFMLPNAGDERASDGAIRPFSIAEGLGPMWLEEDGVDLYTVVDGTDVVLTVDVDARSQVWCPDGTRWVEHDGWLIDGIPLPDGTLALAGRRGPDGSWPSGVVHFDPRACAPVDAQPVCSSLPPYDLAVLTHR